MKRQLPLALAFLLFAACEGPVGPEGPPGPRGPGTRLTFSGQLDSQGVAAVALPIAAGNVESPPVIACYVAKTLSDPFISIGRLGTNEVCGFFGSGGSLSVFILLGDAAHWHYRISVVY